MTDLAHVLNIVVITPLVEDAATLRLLQRAGADCAQGFALGAPAEEWSGLGTPARDPSSCGGAGRLGGA